MGSSHWSDDFYNDRQTHRAATNTPVFVHDAAMRSAPAEARTVHAMLNPLGVRVRESRDSEQHPESIAIAVLLDVTGSMHTVPIGVQRSLPALMGMLIRRGYVEHPQVLFGAVGDEYSDRASLQIGQFESGLEMEDDLGRFWLEKGGGGTGEESYQNGIYFLTRHTSIDCHEKRGKKGYLFIVGDEMPYPRLNRQKIKQILGDDLDRELTVEEVVAEAKTKWDIFYILPGRTDHAGDPRVRRRWETLLGADHFITLPEEEAVSHVIAALVGIHEGRTTRDAVLEDLTAERVPSRLIGTVQEALPEVRTSSTPHVTRL